MTIERPRSTTRSAPGPEGEPRSPALDRLPPDLELVVRCATTAATRDGDRRIDRLVAAGPDWERVLDVAAANDVAPLLCRQLADREGAVPDDVRSRLRASRRRTAARSVYLVDELRSILDDLEAAGVPALPFKGPTLSRSAYEDPALRPFRDLDLLVPRTELSLAVDRLQGRGYSWLGGAPRRDDSAVLGGPLTPPLAPEFRLQRGSTTVELRPGVGEPSRPLDLPFDDLWSRRETLGLAGRETPTLSPADRLLVLAHHGVKHRWERLKWVCDVAEATRAADDLAWGPLLERACSARTWRKLAVALLLADRLLDAPVPPRVARELRADARAVALVDDFVETFATAPMASSDRPARIRYNALAADGAGDAIASVFYSPWFHPGVAEYRLLPLPGPLHPLYYPLRPLRASVSIASDVLGRLRTRLAGPGRSGTVASRAAGSDR